MLSCRRVAASSGEHLGQPKSSLGVLRIKAHRFPELPEPVGVLLHVEEAIL